MARAMRVAGPGVLLSARGQRGAASEWRSLFLARRSPGAAIDLACHPRMALRLEPRRGVGHHTQNVCPPIFCFTGLEAPETTDAVSSSRDRQTPKSSTTWTQKQALSLAEELTELSRRRWGPVLRWAPSARNVYSRRCPRLVFHVERK